MNAARAVATLLMVAALAPAPAAAQSPADVQRDPRAAAREILADDRYSGTDFPRPFRSPLRWLSDRLSPLGDRLADGFERLARWVPGGRPLLWGLLGAAVVLAVALLSRRMIRRRVAADVAARRSATAAAGESAAALERRAGEAERAGDWELAVRLRFRAGLRRLAERGALDDRPSLTTGEVAARLRSPAFDRVGATHDAVVYGGRPAGPQDAETSARGWSEVLDGTGRR